MQARIHNPAGQSRLEELISTRAGLDSLVSLPLADKIALATNWEFNARPKQKKPRSDGWLLWLILAGRGFGKTITGGQCVREWARTPNTRILCVGPTVRDCRETMAKGQSGILRIHPKGTRPHYNQTHGVMRWKNGSQAFFFSAEEPDRFRGPEFHHAWIDEAAACTYINEVWRLAIQSVRLGDDPQIVVTTTPKPIAFLHERLDEKTTIYTHGTTWENEQNLSAKALDYWHELYDGTHVGRQELEAELFRSGQGGRFRQEWFDAHRTLEFPFVDEYTIAIDPSSSGSNEACECGIIGGGIGQEGACYVLHDESMHATPAAWVERVRDLAKRKRAKAIVYEANYGKGFIDDLFKILAPECVPLLKPMHAEQDKWKRAEPVAAFAESGALRMFGHHPKLEDQSANWKPGMKSPDRMDAMVWLARATKLRPEPSIHLENRDTFYA